MLDFIPIDYYDTIYFNIILFVTICTFIYTKSTSGFANSTLTYNKIAIILLLFFLITYIGLRPVSGKFVDMVTYARMYDKMKDGNNPPISSDFGFYYLMQFLTQFNSKTLFFFILSLFYILPLYIASKRWFKQYSFFAFLILVASFSFWAYGTNGLRNGISTSLIILAFSFANNKRVMIPLLLLAYSFHNTSLLIIIIYFTVSFFKNTKIYLTGWILSIFLSILMDDFFEKIITNLGIIKEDKLLLYFSNKEDYANEFSNTGFRWDFLLYSSLPVFISYYFIFIKKIEDKYYRELVNTYLFANAFWILVIRASFSNRFAYLSWFMMGIIMIYPLLKQVYWKNQFAIIGAMIFLYFTFTYLMNVFIY